MKKSENKIKKPENNQKILKLETSIKPGKIKILRNRDEKKNQKEN